MSFTSTATLNSITKYSRNNLIKQFTEHLENTDFDDMIKYINNIILESANRGENSIIITKELKYPEIIDKKEYYNYYHTCNKSWNAQTTWEQMYCEYLLKILYDIYDFKIYISPYNINSSPNYTYKWYIRITAIWDD